MTTFARSCVSGKRAGFLHSRVTLIEQAHFRKYASITVIPSVTVIPTPNDKYFSSACNEGQSLPSEPFPQGNRTWNLRPRWADFAILDEMDSTGSRMIRGAGEAYLARLMTLF